MIHDDTILRRSTEIRGISTMLCNSKRLARQHVNTSSLKVKDVELCSVILYKTQTLYMYATATHIDDHQIIR